MRQKRGEICQAAGRLKSTGLSTRMQKKSLFDPIDIFVPDKFHIANVGEFLLFGTLN